METLPPCRATTILPFRLPATRFPLPSSTASPTVTSPGRRGRPTWPVLGAFRRFPAGGSASSASANRPSGDTRRLASSCTAVWPCWRRRSSRHRAGRGVPAAQGVRTRRLRDRDRQRRRDRRAFEALRRAADRGPARGGSVGALSRGAGPRAGGRRTPDARTGRGGSRRTDAGRGGLMKPCNSTARLHSARRRETLASRAGSLFVTTSQTSSKSIPK